MDASADIQRLKDEGNALFLQKKYEEAIEKYTAALEKDTKNAILFSNRATCALHLNKYVNAEEDAKKATQLDSSYTKAWIRLGTAEHHLGKWNDCINAWNGALSSLPISRLSAQQERQQAECIDNLRQAADGRKVEEWNMHNRLDLCNVGEGNKPAERARAMIPELELKAADENISSAWSIYGADQELSLGMKHLKDASDSGRRNTRALQHLSNALARDPRIFDGVPKDITNNLVIMLDAIDNNTWILQSADTILRDAKQRLVPSSLEDVRTELATTVRGFIIRGYIAGLARGHHGAAVDFYSNAISIIDGGRKLFAEIPEERYDEVFTQGFERCVKSLRLDSLMLGRLHQPEEFGIERIKDLAHDMLDDLKDDPPAIRNMDRGFFLSSWIYPSSKAYTLLKMCEVLTGGVTSADKINHLKRSLPLWTKAADVLPSDDEGTYTCMYHALTIHWNTGASLKVTLPLMEKIKAGMPEVKKIWEHSLLALEGGMSVLENTLRFEARVQILLYEGKCSLRSVLKPDGM